MDLATILMFTFASCLIGAFIDGLRGAALGALLGPLGVLIAAIMTLSKKN